MKDLHQASESVARTVDMELGLVREAIAVVAAGVSPRVVLGGLHFGQELLEPARRLAEGTGTRIVPLWTADEGGADIAVELDSDE